MTAEKIVSRATLSLPSAPESMIETINPNLDHRHRDGQQDRAEWLAELERQHFGVMDSRKHRRTQQYGGENQHHRMIGRNDIGEFQRQKAACKAWCDPGPGRDGGVLRDGH